MPRLNAARKFAIEQKKLHRALRGGNAEKDNAELFEWLADRLVNEYGENPKNDYIIACRERAKMIRNALK